MNVRGLFSSLGAGGSLIAAALCAAALVGGIVAFRGDTGSVAAASDGDVTVPDATATARGPEPGPGSGAAAADVSSPGGAGRVGAGAESRRERPARRRAPRSGTEPVPAGSPSAPAPSQGAPPETPPASDGPGGVPPRPSLRRTVEQTRDAVAPVVEAVPAPVQPPVAAVGDAVENVAGVVDETLAPLLP